MIGGSGMDVTDRAMVRSLRLFLMEKYEQNAADKGNDKIQGTPMLFSTKGTMASTTKKVGSMAQPD